MFLPTNGKTTSSIIIMERYPKHPANAVFLNATDSLPALSKQERLMGI
jgi:hypothetical protein